MNYLMTPPQTHYDCGLGITASNFYSAAQLLQKHEKELLDGVSQICYLQRHSLELFLKSLIYILHKKYEIPFGENFNLENPGILANDKWKPMFSIHDISLLYGYFFDLFTRVKNLLPVTTSWELPTSTKVQIDLISGTDPKSTYFRYPVSSNKEQDQKKSKVQKVDVDSFLAGKKEKPIRAMLMLDSDDNVLECYNFDSEVLVDVKNALNDLCELLNCVHIAFRCELANGF